MATSARCEPLHPIELGSFKGSANRWKRMTPDERGLQEWIHFSVMVGAVWHGEIGYVSGVGRDFGD